MTFLWLLTINKISLSPFLCAWYLIHKKVMKLTRLMTSDVNFTIFRKDDEKIKPNNKDTRKRNDAYHGYRFFRGSK